MGVTWIGVLFAVGWVLAYPASYYGGRALTLRVRRGSWTRLAARERQAAIPWAAAAAAIAVVLVALRPWLLGVGVVLGLLWALSLWIASARGERDIVTDIVLVVQSCVALPLMAAVTADSLSSAAVPASVWWSTAVCATFFGGSVLHVKSLIRGAGNPWWRRTSIGYHVVALAWGLLSPVLLVPFAAALIRALAVPKGARPGAIGGVEAIVSVLVVAGLVITFG